MKRPLFVGIAGGTGSGKSTLADALRQRLGFESTELISHDSYYRELAVTVDPEDRNRTNVDHPDSLESALLGRHLLSLTGGESVEVPIYDFSTHSRSTETRLVLPRKVILIEGILILADRDIRSRLDLKLFVDTPADIRFIRRLRRDIQTRGRSLESVVDQYLATVRPMHDEFVEPSKQHADLIVKEGGRNHSAIDMVVARIETALASSSDELELI